MNTKGEFNTGPDIIRDDKLIQIFQEHYIPKKTLITAAENSSGQNEDDEAREEHWGK